MNKSILLILYIISLGVGQEPPDTGKDISPYIVLFNLSQSKKTERLITYSGMAIAGLLITIIPYENAEVRNTYRLTGAVASGAGLAGMIIPSKAERIFNSVDKELNIVDKDEISYNHLVLLADDAKLKRMQNAFLSGLFSSYYLIGQPFQELVSDNNQLTIQPNTRLNLASGIAYGGLAIMNVMKSKEEIYLKRCSKQGRKK